MKMTSEEMVARVLYRDGMILVVNKPAGLAVHRGPKGAAAKAAGIEGALQDHFDALRFGLPRQPELAHRLDRDTAGCLVLGRHRKALTILGELFTANVVGKTYWAVVEGAPQDDEGVIDLPLGKLNQERGWWMKVDPDGMASLTRWKVMGRADGRTWLALQPVTGRTHQLRVHCQAMNWPILGDTIYGNAPRFGGPGLHLLAREIVVPFSRNKQPIRVTAPVPPHMRDSLMACGWTNDDAAISGSSASPADGIAHATASPPA